MRKTAYESVVGLCDGAVALSNPVTAIAGLNGVGKSMLLRSIWAVLDPVAAQSAVRAHADGTLAEEWRGLKVPGHVEEVLKAVKALKTLKQAA